MATEAKRVTDIGPPQYDQFLHPIIKENYGKWLYHDSIKPGVLSHTGPAGTIFTVRCASPRLVSVNFLRDIMDLADRNTATATSASPAGTISSSCWPKKITLIR